MSDRRTMFMIPEHYVRHLENKAFERNVPMLHVLLAMIAEKNFIECDDCLEVAALRKSPFDLEDVRMTPDIAVDDESDRQMYLGKIGDSYYVKVISDNKKDIQHIKKRILCIGE